MEIPKDVKEKYAQLLCTITQAINWAQKGNVPETKIAVENITERYLSLRLSFNAMGHDDDLDKILAQMPEDEIPSSLTLHAISYAEAPEMFLAEAYLASAERAMKEDRTGDAKDAYKHIKPGEQLRKYLDAQINPINNLNVRAAKLDTLVA
jgi:hypothetical protein